MNPQFDNILPVILILLLAVSVPQLVWARRSIQRIQSWLSSGQEPLELVPFASASRAATWFWTTGLLLSAALFGNAQLWRNDNLFGLNLVSLVWCLVFVLVSWLSATICRDISRFRAVQQLGEQGLADVSMLFPEIVSKPVSETALKRRIGTLGRLTTGLLILLSVEIVLGFLGLMVHGIGTISSAAGQLLLLFCAFVLPGIVAMLTMRGIVKSRAQRAQFLWFLAATAEKDRPLASELSAWGRSHPGRFGARVQEVARDIGVGVSLSNALSAERGLLAPSDLMSIRVAEQTGTLAETLRDSAVRQTQSLKGDSILGNASGTGVWLWAVMVVAMSIVSFVMYYIIPKFKAIFMGFGTELPTITVLMIDLSDIAARWAPLLFPGFLVASVMVLWSCGEAYLGGWSETWLAWKLGIGRQAEVPRLLRRLRGAVLAKLPWPKALMPMVLKHPQDEIRSRLERVLGRVTAGMGVWLALRDAGLLNTRDISLLEMAERANNLEWALAALADSKERTLQHRCRMLLSLAVPVFTVAAGVMVLLICVAFFMPLVKLLNDLS